MSEEMLVRHCSPTLAGLKTGSLFSYRVEDMPLLINKIKKINNMLNSKGVYVSLLRLKGGRALIYVFRPKRLFRDLSIPDAKILLFKNGYPTHSLKGCIDYLSHRLCGSTEFPHEIGLFLGYPIEDIKGFIENKGKNCKYTGCWKVYTNEREAIKTFDTFKKCTDVYCRKFNEGLSIMRLTISV